MRVGLVLFALGLIALLVTTFGQELLGIYRYPPDNWRNTFYVFASQFGPLCLFLGVLCWAVGYIVFALSFLPSSDQNAQDR
jgi:hypothetical protein